MVASEVLAAKRKLDYLRRGLYPRRQLRSRARKAIRRVVRKGLATMEELKTSESELESLVG